ncbi:hypothetical protein KRX19_05730 [Cardiobacteriaceae bacterium TAE3-ERU3]|nr:hypothetical protein [Cardiobacteriaceae bacterium TAE3-ERU3]
MGHKITKELLERDLCAENLEIEESCDSVSVYRTITWHEDSFDWSLGNQSGRECFDSPDEWRGVVFEGTTAHFISDAEFSSTDAKDFSISIPTDHESDELIDFLTLVDQWLEAEIDDQPASVEAVEEVAA